MDLIDRSAVLDLAHVVTVHWPDGSIHLLGGSVVDAEAIKKLPTIDPQEYVTIPCKTDHGKSTFSAIPVRDQDIFPVLASAFRYALGRQTYMPGLISGVIIGNKDLLTEWQRRNLADEVDEYYRTYGNLGDTCDEMVWRRFQREMRGE